MGGCQDHQGRAADALSAAEFLRPDHPAWAMVPLFYSAMHSLHATFDYESIPDDERHPIRHASAWRDAVRLEWDTNDVVVKHCPAKVRSAYRSLYDAGRIVRYDMRGMLGDGTRFWDQFYEIKEYADGVIL